MGLGASGMLVCHGLLSSRFSTTQNNIVYEMDVTNGYFVEMLVDFTSLQFTNTSADLSQTCVTTPHVCLPLLVVPSSHRMPTEFIANLKQKKKVTQTVFNFNERKKKTSATKKPSTQPSKLKQTSIERYVSNC